MHMQCSYNTIMSLIAMIVYEMKYQLINTAFISGTNLIYKSYLEPFLVAIVPV